MSRLTEQEQQEIIRFLEADKPLPDKYRFLLFDEKRKDERGQIVKVSKAEKAIVKREVLTKCLPGRRKLAVKVVDIFGTDTLSIVEAAVGKNNGGD